MEVFHEDEDTAIVCAPVIPSTSSVLAILTCVKGHATNLVRNARSSLLALHESFWRFANYRVCTRDSMC